MTPETPDVFDLVFVNGDRETVYHVFQDREDAEAAASRLNAVTPCRLEVRARPSRLPGTAEQP